MFFCVGHSAICRINHNTKKGKGCYNQLLKLVDEDTQAFNELMNAFGLPNDTKK